MRALILLVSLVLAMTGIWLLVGSEVAPPPEAERPLESDGEAAGRPLAASPPVAEPPDERATVTSAPVGEGEVLYQIRVVHADSREPVPGATAHWLPPGFDHDSIPEAERSELRRRQGERARRYGLSATADTGGRFAVRGTPARLRLYAFREGWYGELDVEARDPRTKEIVDPEPEYTLEVRRDQTLVVRTVDGAGQPVPGVKLLLRVAVIRDGESGGVSYSSRPTDGQGLMSWPHAQLLGSPGRFDSASVSAALYGGLSDPVALDLRNVPLEPVDVVLPAFGSMEVVVLAPDGFPWTNHESRVSVVAAEPAGFMSNATIRFGADGFAIVPHVICGEKLRVRTRLGGTLVAIVDGPERQGERVRVELPMPGDIPILAGRIVNTGGDPQTDSFFAQVESGSGVTSVSFRTDENGAFRAPLASRYAGRLAVIKVTRTVERMRPSVPSAFLRLNNPIQLGLNELGDLEFAQPPVLVAGRMEWADGTPVRTPQFSIQYTLSTAPNETPQWRDRMNLFPQHLGDGRFIVREQAKSDRYRLVLVGQGFVPVRPIRFTPGTEDLVIRVSRGGAVEVSVIGDGADLLRALRCRLVSLSAGQETREARGFSVRGTRASYTWTGVPKGRYSLAITVPGMPALATIAPIDVPVGGSVEDPRLTDIDLRGRLQRIEVGVDTGGAPMRDTTDAVVMIRGREHPDAEWYARVLSGRDSLVDLVVPSPVDLLISVPGFRTAEAFGVFADTTVRLEPAPSLRVRLAESVQLPTNVTAALFVSAGRSSSPGVRIEGSGSAYSTSSVDAILGRRNQTVLADRDGEFVVDTRGGGNVSWNLVLQNRGGSDRNLQSVKVQPDGLDLDALYTDSVIELQVHHLSLQKALDEIGK